MTERAFDGTVLEGRERRYTVIKESDVMDYTDYDAHFELNSAINIAGKQIEKGRIKDGKFPFNNYIVINVDEPYVGEIIEVMKRHGHWEEGEADD